MDAVTYDLNKFLAAEEKAESIYEAYALDAVADLTDRLIDHREDFRVNGRDYNITEIIDWADIEVGPDDIASLVLEPFGETREKFEKQIHDACIQWLNDSDAGKQLVEDECWKRAELAREAAEAEAYDRHKDRMMEARHG